MRSRPGTLRARARAPRRAAAGQPRSVDSMPESPTPRTGLCGSSPSAAIARRIGAAISAASAPPSNRGTPGPVATRAPWSRNERGPRVGLTGVDGKRRRGHPSPASLQARRTRRCRCPPRRGSPSFTTVLSMLSGSTRTCRAGPTGTFFIPLSTLSLARSAGGSLPCAIGTASSADGLGDVDDRLVDGHQLLAVEDALDPRQLGVLTGHGGSPGRCSRPSSRRSRRRPCRRSRSRWRRSRRLPRLVMACSISRWASSGLQSGVS